MLLQPDRSLLSYHSTYGVQYTHHGLVVIGLISTQFDVASTRDVFLPTRAATSHHRLTFVSHFFLQDSVSVASLLLAVTRIVRSF